MPFTVLGLLFLAVLLLFLIEVVLGAPSTTGSQEGQSRLSVREFMTRLVPLYCLGLGVAGIVAWPLFGTVLILLSMALWVYGSKAKT